MLNEAIIKVNVKRLRKSLRNMDISMFRWEWLLLREYWCKNGREISITQKGIPFPYEITYHFDG